MATTLLSDDFNRANNTSVVGSPATGPAPTIWTGTLGINTNQLYSSALTSSEATVVWDLQQDLDFQIALGNTTGNFNVVFGASNTDHVLFQVANVTAQTRLGLYQRRSGTYVQMVSGAGRSVASVAGDVFRVVRSGQKLAVSLGGTWLYAAESLGGLPIPTTGYTKWGVRFESTNTRWDSAFAQTIDTFPFDRLDSTITASGLYKGRDTYTLDAAAEA